MQAFFKFIFAIALLFSPTFQTANADEPPKIVANFLIVGVLNNKAKIEDGETACIVTNSDGKKWELNLGDSGDLRKLASELHGKKVVVNGGLTKIRRLSGRYILKVSSLELYVDKPFVNAFIGKDRNLKNRISLKDSRFVSDDIKGFVWTIEKNGEWRRQAFHNDKIAEPDKSGKLKTFDLLLIAVTFEQNKFSNFPKQIGSAPDAPSRLISVAVGEKESQLVVSKEVPLTDFDPKGGEGNERLFGNIVRLLSRYMTSDSTPK